MKKTVKTSKANSVSRLSAVTYGLLVVTTAGTASAQTQTNSATIDDLQEVTVVGSRIKGAVITDALQSSWWIKS